MKFELKEVEVNVLHVMTTKAQAESQLYTSIKIGVDSIPDSAVSALMGGKSAGEVRQSFFADGKPRFNKVHELAVNREYLAKHMIEIEGLEQQRVTKLWKANLTVLSEGGFGLQFSVQVDTPNAIWMHSVHELHKKKCAINLVQDTNELLDSDSETKTERPSPRTRKPDTIDQQQPAMH